MALSQEVKDRIDAMNPLQTLHTAIAASFLSMGKLPKEQQHDIIRAAMDAYMVMILADFMHFLCTGDEGNAEAYNLLANFHDDEDARQEIYECLTHMIDLNEKERHKRVDRFFNLMLLLGPSKEEDSDAAKSKAP